jgi:hypothetical protein
MVFRFLGYQSTLNFKRINGFFVSFGALREAYATA